MAMATANSPQSIRDWYHSCIATFEKVTNGVSSCNLASGSHELALQLVRDQIGRFRVWAGNLGAHHPASSMVSLDYKLKEALHIRNTVVELLVELHTTLEVLYSTQKNPADPDLSIEEAEETYGGGAEENDGEGFGDDVPDPSWSTTSESSSSSALSELVFILDDIAHIISCLYTLSVAMRQPVPQDRHRKYAEIDLSHYEFFDNQHVLEKFPNAKPLLIKRLGSANMQRRQYFEYRRLHHEKIARGLEHPGSEDAGTVITADKTSTTISIVPKSAVLRTQPVPDTIEAESDGGQTATSFGTVMETGKVKLLKVPDPPDADFAFAGNAFQCPYCYCLIIVKNSRAWRRHVFRDLRPYVCTFDSCTKPNHLFETRHDWYDHEVQHHRHEWYCAECAIAFATSSIFICHLKEVHPALLGNEQDVSALVDGCERAMSGPQQCPLCVGQSGHAAQRLRSHLGRHMQQLALFTLPRLEMNESEGRDLPSEAGLNGGESSEGEEEEMSGLEFDSNPSQDSPDEDEEGSGRGGGAKKEGGAGGAEDGPEKAWVRRPLPPLNPNRFEEEEWYTPSGKKVRHSAMHLHMATM